MAYQAYPRSKALISGTSNYLISFEFLGADEATEPRFVKELTVTPDMTVAQGQEWVYNQITNAKPKKSVADLIVVGTPVTPKAPAAAAGPTADETWLATVAKYRALKALLDSGVAAGQATTDLSALKATVESGYTTARGAML